MHSDAVTVDQYVERFDGARTLIPVALREAIE
jgi:hypothetical protein